MNLVFKGWGRKYSGKRAIFLSKLFRKPFLLYEDGFIRSCGLGNSVPFSLVEDDRGIYYDARTQSKLENILQTYNFKNDDDLIELSRKAINMIKKYKISKYNHSDNFIAEDLNIKGDKNVLVVAQTKGDLSLKYGFGYEFSTNDMIKAALNENPNSKVYIKIHPDVINGKKKSDININLFKKSCKLISRDINPISLLEKFSIVYTKTSQMGFEALIMGCKCVCFGAPFYSGWGLTDDRVKIKRRNRKLSLEELFAGSYIIYSKYTNPYSKKSIDIIQAINEIIKNRQLLMASKKKLFLFGFSKWKRKYVLTFLKDFEKKNIFFINDYSFFYKKVIKSSDFDYNSEIYIWGAKKYPLVEKITSQKNIKITRVEDGFIRSISLGSDLTRPYSLIFDEIGIYYDPRKTSKLEKLINETEFEDDIIKDANNLIDLIIKLSISKYNTLTKDDYSIPKNINVILVVGQVEDDASVIYGANSMSNHTLLKTVRKENPSSFLIYKPHPDVVCGNRIGDIRKNETKKYCDLYLKNVNISKLIKKVNEVHTMTSLVGFEGLIHGKKVFTYGMPFYAGWGLTIDKLNCSRRNRNVSLQQLVAAALILYPKYIDHKTHNLCNPETVIRNLYEAKFKLENSFLIKLKRNIYCFFSRKIQKLLRKIL